MEKRKRAIPLNLQLFSELAPEPTPEPTPEPPKTFTQEDLDKILADRISRERKKFGDYDETKAKLAEYEKEREEAEKAKLSEIERANKEREDALAKLAEFEKQTVELAKQRETDVVNFAIKLAAKDSVDPDAVALMLDRSALKVENGEAVGVVEAIEALKASKPYLFTKPAEPKPIGGGGIPPKQDEIKTLEAQLAEAKKAGDFAKVIELSNKLRK